MSRSNGRLALYDLPDEIRAVEEEIIEADGEITPEIEAKLDALEGEVERKVEYLALLSREARAEAKGVKEEEDRLKARRTAAENREKRLKDYLHACLTKLGRDRVEGDRIKVRVQENSRPSITWMGEDDEIPGAYRQVSVRPDGALAYEDWKAGVELPDGFRVEVGQHVRVW